MSIAALAHPRTDVGPMGRKYDQTPTLIGMGAGAAVGSVAGPWIALKQMADTGVEATRGVKALSVVAAGVLGVAMGALLVGGAVDIVRSFIPDAK
ncbi:MAG: hypothetical protein JWM90_446 [Thermoleophilia bacterium]|nr:hypothetical protein [Thermoleophilia bacterium]